MTQFRSVGVIAIALLAALVSASKYEVVVQRVNSQQPMFHKGSTSVFDYSYNPTLSAMISSNGSVIENTPMGLIVRCQNNASGWTVTPSELAYSALETPIDLENIGFAPITNATVVMRPSGPEDNYGDEDPRIVYREADGTYYLLYSAVETQQDGSLSCKLSLATSTTPSVPGSWDRKGPVVPEVKWSKSGALLLRDDVPGSNHYMFFGDSSISPGLQAVTISPDLKTWTLNSSIWLPLRSDHFDSLIVEGGPMPLRLSDGNYLMLYNSARHGYPSPKPGFDLQYNVGFLILDGTDPTRILQRSDEPIFSPELDWEIGFGPGCLTPHVVFAEGWVPLPGAQPNTFLMFYGAADTYVGAAVVSVFIDDS